jgi:hypothetical protein
VPAQLSTFLSAFSATLSPAFIPTDLAAQYEDVRLHRVHEGGEHNGIGDYEHHLLERVLCGRCAVHGNEDKLRGLSKLFPIEAAAVVGGHYFGFGLFHIAANILVQQFFCTIQCE